MEDFDGIGNGGDLPRISRSHLQPQSVQCLLHHHSNASIFIDSVLSTSIEPSPGLSEELASIPLEVASQHGEPKQH